jgi:hypothetical protein
VPFVNGENDIRFLDEVFTKPAFVRAYTFKPRVISRLHGHYKLWLDAGVDSLENGITADQTINSYFTNIDGHEVLTQRVIGQKVDNGAIEQFVGNLLDKCRSYKPLWISVPQLPFTLDKVDNSINRSLAKASEKWNDSQKSRSKLILPVILTHQDQVNYADNRKKIARLTSSLLDLSNADGIWVVERSMADTSGSQTLGRKRIPNTIKLHEELMNVVSGLEVRLAGPYWGTNLILWVRELITHPAIGMGKGFQYYSPGGHIMRGRTKIAIPSFLRTATVSNQLNTEFRKMIRSLPSRDPLSVELQELHQNMSKYLSDESIARKQIASFYVKWLQRLESLPEGGRALALYQDFSSAFVAGRRVSVKLPKAEKSARSPGQVAEQFMLHCL